MHRFTIDSDSTSVYFLYTKKNVFRRFTKPESRCDNIFVIKLFGFHSQKCSDWIISSYYAKGKTIANTKITEKTPSYEQKKKRTKPSCTVYIYKTV